MKTILFLFVLMCPTMAQAAESVLLRDDLKGLQADWKWIREDRDNWRIHNKVLEIRVLPGNMWGRSNNAKNVLVRPVAFPKDGTLEVSVTVENQPTNQYEQIDLVLYYDDGHMVKIGQELVHGKLSVVMGREEEDRTRTIAIIPLQSNRVGLRYLIKANTIHGFYRPEGAKTWKEAGSCNLPRPKNARPHVSLQAYQGPKDKAHWARITDLQIRTVTADETAKPNDPN